MSALHKKRDETPESPGAAQQNDLAPEDAAASSAHEGSQNVTSGTSVTSGTNVTNGTNGTHNANGSHSRRSSGSGTSAGVRADQSEVVNRILSALAGLDYGSVEIIVQDFRVVQIERTQKSRFVKPLRIPQDH